MGSYNDNRKDRSILDLALVTRECTETVTRDLTCGLGRIPLANVKLTCDKIEPANAEIQ